MRKIVVTFICAIACCCVGFGIFVAEIAKIEEKPVVLQGEEKTYTKKIDSSIEDIDIDTEYSSYVNGDYNGYHTVQLKEMVEDPSLDPDTIQISYSSVFDLSEEPYDYDDDHDSLDLYFKLHDKKYNGEEDYNTTLRSLHSIAENVAQVWKQKKVKKIHVKDNGIRIRYGSNLRNKIDVDQDVDQDD